MSAEPDQDLIEKLRRAGARVNAVECARRGFHLEVRADMACLEACARAVRDAGLYPVFMTAVHADSQYLLYYQFAAGDRPLRVMLSAPADNENRTRSLTPLFPGLQWHEREAREMFGIFFENHPAARPLFLCAEDRDLHPLRKNATRLKTPAQLGLMARPDTDGDTP